MKPVYLKDILSKHEEGRVRISGVPTSTPVQELTESAKMRVGRYLQSVDGRRSGAGLNQITLIDEELTRRTSDFVDKREEKAKATALRLEQQKAKAAENDPGDEKPKTARKGSAAKK